MFQGCLSVMGAASCYPSSPWTSYDWNRRPVRVVKTFWYSQSLKVPRNVFYSWGDHSNLRNREVRTRKECIYWFLCCLTEVINYGAWTWRWRTSGKVHKYYVCRHSCGNGHGLVYGVTRHSRALCLHKSHGFHSKALPLNQSAGYVYSL